MIIFKEVDIHKIKSGVKPESRSEFVILCKKREWKSCCRERALITLARHTTLVTKGSHIWFIPRIIKSSRLNNNRKSVEKTTSVFENVWKYDALAVITIFQFSTQVLTVLSGYLFYILLFFLTIPSFFIWTLVRLLIKILHWHIYNRSTSYWRLYSMQARKLDISKKCISVLVWGHSRTEFP